MGPLNQDAGIARDAALAPRPDAGIQEYKNDKSLSDDEVDTIVNWVDAGRPRAIRRTCLAPEEFASEDEWAIGKPESDRHDPKEITMPAGGPIGGPTSPPRRGSPKTATSRPSRRNHRRRAASHSPHGGQRHPGGGRSRRRATARDGRPGHQELQRICHRQERDTSRTGPPAC